MTPSTIAALVILLTGSCAISALQSAQQAETRLRRDTGPTLVDGGQQKSPATANVLIAHSTR